MTASAAPLAPKRVMSRLTAPYKSEREGTLKLNEQRGEDVGVCGEEGKEVQGPVMSSQLLDMCSTSALGYNLGARNRTRKNKIRVQGSSWKRRRSYATGVGGLFIYSFISPSKNRLTFVVRRASDERVR